MREAMYTKMNYVSVSNVGSGVNVINLYDGVGTPWAGTVISLHEIHLSCAGAISGNVATDEFESIIRVDIGRNSYAGAGPGQYGPPVLPGDGNVYYVLKTGSGITDTIFTAYWNARLPFRHIFTPHPLRTTYSTDSLLIFVTAAVLPDAPVYIYYTIVYGVIH